MFLSILHFILQLPFETLQKIFKVIKKSPWATFFAIMAFFSLYITFQTAESVKTISEDPKTNQQHFESAVAISDEVNSSLQHLRENTGAVHAIVRQFHNGKQDLTGLPFTYISTTYANLSPGIGLDDTAFDSIPLSTMNRSLAKMWTNYENPQCIAGLTQDIPDPIFKSFLERYQIKRYVQCPMTNLLSYPIGVVFIGFLDEDMSNSINEIQKTKEVSDRVTGYLGTIKDSGGEDILQRIYDLF